MTLLHRFQSRLQQCNIARLLLFCLAGWIGSFGLLWLLLQTLLGPTITDEISDKIEKNARLVEAALPHHTISELPIGVMVVEGERPPSSNTDVVDHFDRHLIKHLRDHHQLRNPIIKATDAEIPGLSGYWVQLQRRQSLSQPTWLYVPSRLASSRWFWPLQGTLSALLGTLLGALAFFHCCVNQPLKQVINRLPERQLPSEFTLLPEQGIAPIQDLSARINRLLCSLNQQANDRHRLLRGMVHDLRGPLTRLLVRVDRLDQAETAAGIQTDLQAIRQLIDQLAALSSQEQPASSHQPLALDERCSSVLSSYPREAGLELQVPRLLVRLDGALLERTLNNLIDNAMEYGAAPILLSAHIQRGQLVIQVEDHGPGLSSYEQLLTPYSQPSHDRGLNQHSGLGLAIAERFCRSHGGSLHLGPAPHGGLQVQLRLPGTVLINS